MATEYDITSAAAAVYAESLLELARDAGKAEEIGDELAQLVALGKSHPTFASMMRSAALDDDARRGILQRMFTGRVSPLVLNLMLVLNDRQRSYIFKQVCAAYQRKLDESLGRTAVYVSTAVALDEAARARVREEVRRLTGLDSRFEERVDPTILGGLIVQAGDRLYDYSVRRRLHDLQHRLHETMRESLVGGVSKFVTQG